MADEVIHTIDYHVSVDLYDRTVKSSMYCRSNDTANRIYLTLHRGGEIYDVHDDVFAQVLYYRDGEESEHESPIVQIAYPYHGRVIIDVPAGVINEPGEVNVRVKLYSNQFGTAEIVSTPIWRIIVPDDAYFDEGIPPAESQSGYDYVVSTWNAADLATADATNAAEEARAARDAAREIVNGLVAITENEIDEICI